MLFWRVFIGTNNILIKFGSILTKFHQIPTDFHQNPATNQQIWFSGSRLPGPLVTSGSKSWLQQQLAPHKSRKKRDTVLKQVKIIPILMKLSQIFPNLIFHKLVILPGANYQQKLRTTKKIRSETNQKTFKVLGHLFGNSIIHDDVDPTLTHSR